MSAKEYLEKFGVESAVAKAVTQVLKDRPADPIAAIGKILLSQAISKGVGVGSTFPMDVVVHQGFAGNTPDAPKPMSAFLTGVKALVVSLPGAFTPTWSTCQVPGLKAAEIDGRLEAAGIEKVYVFCVNDGAVMKAWKKAMGLEGSDMIEFLADTHADLTDALGLVLTGEGKAYPKGDGPNKALGFHTKRCKRSAMFVDNGVIKVMQIAEAPDDPAGDARPEVSCIENMIKLIKEL